MFGWTPLVILACKLLVFENFLRNSTNIRHVHSYSTLSRVYFENILCLDPITSVERRTTMGIRCGLGDESTYRVLCYDD